MDEMEIHANINLITAAREALLPSPAAKEKKEKKEESESIETHQTLPRQAPNYC